MESDYSAEVSFTTPSGPGNQPPTLDALVNMVINENAGAQTVNLTGITSGSTNEIQTLTVTATSSNTGLIPAPAVSYTSPNTTGSISFTPAVNGNGSATITVTVNDGGPSNNIVQRSFTVTVNPVNQPPTLNPLNNLTINENAGQQTVNLSGISSGATNENQTLTVSASSSNIGLIPNPTVSYTSPNGTGSIRFSPVTNANGSATITVTVNDGGGSNNIVTQTFIVTVNPVNQPPTLNSLGNLTISENAGLQTVNLAGISSGATNENQTLVVTASSSNPGLIPAPAVSYTSPNPTGSISFAPGVNGFGSSVITVTVNDGGASNNVVSRTFTVTVTAVNQPPTLNPLSDLAINENAGLQTVNLSGITSGATNENQTLTVTASSSNTGLIPTPSVSYTSPNATGTISFTPAVNGFGSAVITVKVNDGGTSNNIVTQTFTVTVNPVNQPPTLNPLSNLTVVENSGLATVNLSGISSGATNENQVLTVSASSGNTGLIPTPSVNYTSPNATGSITFTPTPGQIGSSVITVTVNDGGTSNNIVTRTFTVNVDSPPSISAIPDQTIATNSSTGPLSFVIGDVETAASALTLSATSSSTTLIPVSAIVFGGSGSNRTLTLTPVVNRSGSSLITISVSDGFATTSTSFQLNVLGPPNPPNALMIVTNGNGSVTPNLNGKGLQIGRTYTVTAAAAADSVFVGWSGTYSSTNPNLTFMMTSNLVLQANFMKSPYIPVAGNYNGLFYESDEVRVAHSGFFSLLATRNGHYTGVVQIGAKRYPIAGKLGLDAKASKTILRGTNTPLYVEFSLTNNQVTGQVSNVDWAAALLGDRTVFDPRTNAVPYLGRYTLLIPGVTNDPALPYGHSFGAVRVDAWGRAHFYGRLADGAIVSQNVPLSKSGSWPLYSSLYAGNGALLSWMTFTNRPGDDLNGMLSWIRLQNTRAQYYRGGFTNVYGAIGSAYATPVGTNILNLSSAQLSFNGGELGAGFSDDVTLGLHSNVLPGTNRLAMAFTLINGLYSGTMVDPASGRRYYFRGAVLPKLNAGYGYLLGTNQSSSVLFEP